jgi:hypothetical protein
VRGVTGVAGPSEFLTAADLRERYHCSRMWIVRQIQQHHFPKPIGVGVVRRCVSRRACWRSGASKQRGLRKPRDSRRCVQTGERAIDGAVSGVRSNTVPELEDGNRGRPLCLV